MQDDDSQVMLNVGRNKSSQFRQKRNAAPLPEQASQATLVGTLICAVLPLKASSSAISRL